MVAQRGLILRAIREDTVPLICQSFIVQFLKSPDHRLHIRGIQGLIPVLKVYPARLAVDIIFPLIRIFQDRCAACFIKPGKSHFIDLAFIFYAKFFFGFKLRREAVGIPPKDTVDPTAFHSLVTRDHIFCISGKKMAIVRQPIGEGGAVKKDEFIRRVIPGRALLY